MKQLDEVSAGQANWKKVLGNFWPGFHGNVLDAMKVPVEKVQLMLPVPFILHHFLPVSMVLDILGVFHYSCEGHRFICEGGGDA